MSFLTDLNPDDDFLLDDALPCLRKEGKLYYLSDVQPRVLDACRCFGLSFEQLADKLGMMRPALVLILKGYDPVPPNLKAMLDRLVLQAATMQGDIPASESATQSDAPVDVTAEPVPAAASAAVDTPAQKVTIMSIPVPEPAAAAEAPEEVVIPDVVSLDRPATPHVVIPTPPAFEEGLPGVTTGLRRAPRGALRRSSGGKPGQFLLT